MSFSIWLFWFCGSRISSLRNSAYRFPAWLIPWKMYQLSRGHTVYLLSMYSLTQSFAINDFLQFFTLFLLPIEFIVDGKLYFCLFWQLMLDCVYFKLLRNVRMYSATSAFPSCCFPWWLKYFPGWDLTKKSSVLLSLWDRASFFFPRNIFIWSASVKCVRRLGKVFVWNGF